VQPEPQPVAVEHRPHQALGRRVVATDGGHDAGAGGGGGDEWHGAGNQR
jgi:hypothetical protein